MNEVFETDAAEEWQGQTDAEVPSFLSARTGCDWRVLEKSDDEEPDDINTASAIFKRSVLDILLSPNLVVLCGLGPSMCLKGSGDHPLAPSMSSLWQETSQRSDFKAIINKTGYSIPTFGPNIEQLLSFCQLYQQLHTDSQIAEFITSAEGIIVDRCRFVKVGMKLEFHEAFLRKVARRSTRLPRMKLFTTNYDLCFETAASSTRFVVIDGFSHTHPQEFDGTHFGYDLVRRDEEREGPDYIPNVFHLYKIHGSVDWASSGGSVTRGGEPDKPLIIYPRHSKFELSYSQPFLEMMSRLQIALRQPNTGLLIIGFGFNDEHINQPIVSAVRSNVALKAMVVGPSLADIPPSKTALLELRKLLDAGDHRLSFLSAKFEQLVPLLPELVAYTEEEQHRGRLTKIGAN